MKNTNKHEEVRRCMMRHVEPETRLFVFVSFMGFLRELRKVAVDRLDGITST